MKKLLIIFIAFSLIGQNYSQKLKKLGIDFESTTYNFGDVQMWENQPAMFKLTNNSKHAISILPLFSENDLEIIYPDYSILPGETAIIKAIYYTSGTGNFSRKFPIYFNTSPEAYFLKITGNIKSLSPTAYIQCPMSKPEHSKPKVELFGNVAEIDSEIPLSGSVVKITGVSSNVNATFYADKNGNFGSKMPTGNYEVIVNHPNYKPHHSFFYLGQNTGHLKIRLEPVNLEPILADNPLEKQQEEFLETKTITLPPNDSKTPPNNVVSPVPTSYSKPPSIEPEQMEAINKEMEAIPKTSLPSKVQTFDVPADFPTQNTKTPADKEEIELRSSDPITKYPNNTPPNSELNYPDNNTNQVPSAKETSISEQDNTSNPKYSNPPKKNTPLKMAESAPITPSKQAYMVRVLDEKTLEPIEDAQLYISPVLDKKKTTRSKSDLNGMATLELDKMDYKVVASADNYISGNAKIKAEQDDEIIRIYLAPVSDLFDDIYAAKKEENDPKSILGQLSFGKTEFSFAKDEKDDIPEPVISSIPETSEPENVIEEETSSLPTPLETEEITAITSAPSSEEKQSLPELEPPTPEPIPTYREQEKLDSIQTILAEMLAEKEAAERELAKAAEDLKEKEDLIAQKEDELSLKEEELSQQSDELEKVKTDFNETQEALDKQKLALDNLEKEQAKREEESLELSRNDYAANNVVFLIDVSSSMGKENKMELLKESITNLALVLRDIDRVAIIAYNQKSTVVLESISGSNKSEIIAAIDSLETSGLTYGVSGLQTAYDLLQYYYIGDGNNQIILATDGLFSSVNATMTENELNKEVRKQVADNNIRLSVVGFGQDENGKKLMQKLANNGDGQFIQIKNPWEAQTVLIEEIKINSKF